MRVQFIENLQNNRAGAISTASTPHGKKLLSLLAALRTAGVEITGELAEDDQFARAAFGPQKEGGTASDKGGAPQFGNTEEDLRPFAGLGVAEGLFPPTQPGYYSETAVRWFGTYSEMVGDLSSMGAGNTRRVKMSDAFWGSVFPQEPTSEKSFQDGVEIPAPGIIRSMLIGSSFRALSRVGALLAVCHVRGVRVGLTPFGAGGGASLNVGPNPADEVKETGVTYGDLRKAQPAHQTSCMVLSTEGWSDFYWGHLTDTDESVFQQYALNVWPPDTLDSERGYVSDGMRTSARRKGLALSAFAQGLAEYLAVWDGVLRALDPRSEGVADIVGWIELGNELDHFFRQGDRDSSIQSRGAREAGRYMALIAGPMWHALPTLKFRAAELGTWSPNKTGKGCEWTDDFTSKADWLRKSIEEGIASEIFRWSTLQLLSLVPDALRDLHANGPMANDWLADCAAAGYYWPPRPSSTADMLTIGGGSLVHQAGFHFYLCYNRTQDGLIDIPSYQDEVRLVADIEAFRALVVTPLLSRGYNLSISIGETGFPCVDPGPRPLGAVWSPFFDGTNERYQAAILLRRLLTARAAGVEYPTWFCQQLAPKERHPSTIVSPVAAYDGWALATSLAVHNELYEGGTYRHSDDAWPLPSWYTFRRLSWLLQNALGCELLIAKSGFVVVRLNFGRSLTNGPSGRPLARPRRYAYLTWVDQYCDNACLHPYYADVRETGGTGYPAWLQLIDRGGDGYELLPLVPDLGTASSVDSNGYPRREPVDWFWSGWDSALGAASVAIYDGVQFLTFSIEKAHPVDRPAPLCILTDADYLGAG